MTDNNNDNLFEQNNEPTPLDKTSEQNVNPESTAFDRPEEPTVNPESTQYSRTQEQNINSASTYEYNAEPIPPQQEKAPNQNPYYTNSSYYSNQQQPQPQPSQSQWSFNEYGPMNGAPSPQKKPKKPAGKGAGLKIFAVTMSALFIVAVSALVYFVIDDNNNQPIIDNQPTQSQVDPAKPSMNLENAPKDETPDTDPATGRMTTMAVNKMVNPSVVGIVTYTRTTGYAVSGQGSGVILSKDGYIITNCHVIEASDPRMPIAKIEVILDNKETYVAKLLGSDSKSDLAVLKIEADNLTAATFGDSDDLEVGETVIVIGNPSGQTFAGSLTQGVVSALNREVYVSDTGETLKFIQTDAAINPGNSGGALVNQYGQVIGISSAKIAATGFEGMGFAIPSNIAKPIVNSIIENGYVTGRAKIGISYTTLSNTLAQLNGLPRGLRVVEVEPTFDVFAKGVQLGDIITKIDGKDVYDQATLSAALAGKKPNDEIMLSIFRVDDSGQAKTFEVSVVLGEDKPVDAQEITK